ESTHEAFEAGATLVHCHVRNEDETPSSDPEKFARLLEGIREHCPGMIVQFSTGGRSGVGRERGGMLPLRPDMASLSTGSCNFPTRVYENSPELIDWLAAEMKKYGVKPEIEVFDLSMLFKAVEMQKEGKIDPPLHVQFVMGVKNAMPVDREVFEFYIRTLKRLAPDATWTGAGIGKDQITLNRWSLELGGHCRTGLEDNVRLDRHTLAPSNAALVRRVVELCPEYGRRPATVAEARALLHLPPWPAA
ncbi:MAG: 3-keto-5-aminohexanoate cleavage protein, partial [Geminicoccaceae bacterium]|nr:3-keto-5-aminohexanoate cleavage protein [Geminicoccaceae bacterium]